MYTQREGEHNHLGWFSDDILYRNLFIPDPMDLLLI